MRNAFRAGALAAFAVALALPAGGVEQKPHDAPTAPAAAAPPAPAAAAPGEPAPTQAEFVAKGKAIVDQYCARCHATGMADKSPHEKAPPFRDVVERYPSENLAEALAEGIVSGHQDMPVFVFNPPEIEAFLAYLDSLERPKGK